MKKVTVLLAAIALSANVFSQTWTLDKAHSKLGFSITHLLVNDVDGSFKNVDASITSSKPDFSDAVFSVTAQAASVFTDNDKRDEHLRGTDFFDVEKNPTVTFHSKSLKKAGNNSYTVMGDLTLHGITKPVVLNVSFKGPATHPMTKKTIAGFKVTGTINRTDFKLGDKYPGAMLSEEVALTANGEFEKG